MESLLFFAFVLFFFFPVLGEKSAGAAGMDK